MQASLRTLIVLLVRVAAHPRVIEWAKGQITHEVDIDEDYFLSD